MSEEIELFAGVDIGSTAVRVGLLDKSCTFYGEAETEPISYHQSAIDPRFVTQSSAEVWASFLKCFSRLKAKLASNEIIKSISCAATCSMVVMKRVEGGSLEPYPTDYGFKDKNQNIVFWMDSRASKETEQINNILHGNKVLEYYGGSFIEEMGIPKAKYMIDHIPESDLHDIVLFDLHDFLIYKLGEHGSLLSGVTASNESSQIAIDGELKGWSGSFLNSIGLELLSTKNFAAIGSLEKISSQEFSSIPLAGSRVGTSNSGLALCQGVIDSYAGWLGSCGTDIQNSLTMVAGTSTCYLVGHESETTIPGVWGPFEGILPDLFVSEGGQSTTGKLIEHLFDSHPAYTKLKPDHDVFGQLESLIQTIEKDTDESIHYSTKHMFLYGDLSGNRTPYCDGSMRGVFFGESTDISLQDLVLKYVCILEFLAFQSKQIVDLMSGYDIRKIVVCGSQAKNRRLLKLISLVTELPVQVSSQSSELSGVRGAAFLAMSGYLRLPLTDIVTKMNQTATGTIVIAQESQILVNLLNKKYEIMLDIVQRQLHYKKMIDDTID